MEEDRGDSTNDEKPGGRQPRDPLKPGSPAVDRRKFVMALAAVSAASFVPLRSAVTRRSGKKVPPQLSSRDAGRIEKMYRVRIGSARRRREVPLPKNAGNGDEEKYPSRIASFTRALPHNKLGEVDVRAYDQMVGALKSGRWADLEMVSFGGSTRLANPLAAYSLTMEGLDSAQTFVETPHSFESAGLAADAVELYWHALARDVVYEEFDGHPMVRRACDELSKLSGYAGPRENGRVTPQTIFRDDLPGAAVGPYISQFLWKEISQGPIQVFPKIRTFFAEYDYLTLYDDWLAIQNGAAARATQLGTHRYIRTGRDLSAYVHFDFTNQAFVNAALILASMQGTTDARMPYRGAPFDAANPYRRSKKQSTFVTFGQPDILDLVSRATVAALKSVWYHKWLIHRRMRPEEFGGRVHNHLMKKAIYPIHPDLLGSTVLEDTMKAHGSYLLPQAFPEGAPNHPAYPAGHATIAGACVTVLKAFFDENWPVDDPVVATPDGLSLRPYRGPTLTIGGELNKLAMNVGSGRGAAGVHWRSDSASGFALGEQAAIAILEDARHLYAEPFEGFRLTKFDGTTITI